MTSVGVSILGYGLGDDGSGRLGPVARLATIGSLARLRLFSGEQPHESLLSDSTTVDRVGLLNLSFRLVS